MVQIQLFGGVSATTANGQPIDVGPAKAQAVLAALALSAGSAVPVARLVELVWGDRPPRTAPKTLQSYVTRLRKGLGPDSIARPGAAYRLDVSPDAIDVVRFQTKMDAGDREAALAEWTGVPLAGLDAPGLTGVIDALVEQWLGAVEIQLGQRVETDPAAAIGPLTELTANHPFREGLWALLMTALYRVGRQADALAAYRRVRAQLVEHLGVEPGPRLRDLESSVLGQDEQLRLDRPLRAGPAVAGLPTGTVTFGFADFDDAAPPDPAGHDAVIRTTVDRHGGYVFGTSGDAFAVAFHRASDAVAWAIELRAATGAEWRLGLHTGETQERGKGYFGPALIVGARLAAAAHGGQVLLSGVTAVLLDRHDLRDLGTYRLDPAVPEQRVLQLGDEDFPPLRLDDSRRGNLPRQAGRLVGRHDDLEVVAGALAKAPIVTLVGPGGIGKTQLALAAARRLVPDRTGGVWLVELGEVVGSADVPRAVADALTVLEAHSRSLTGTIVDVLRRRRALILLDSCEHVIDGAAAMASAISAGCPEVIVLATSREGLGLTDEQLIAVGPLEPSGPGVQLFNERAAAASLDFDPLAHRDAVEEICRRLDGIPLAIELAAARTTSLSPADLVDRLDDRLRLLTGGRRNSIERHRTIRATVQWSYDLLAPAERVLFQRLTIFAGPFDLAAAEAVAADATLHALDVDDLLGGLVERSMVVVESGPGGRRFRLLETMRQFGAEHLSDAGHTELLAERHARWCVERVRQIRRLLAGLEEIEGVAQLSELWTNLRAAVEWTCAVGDRQLARALVEPVASEVWLRCQTEIGDWAERILAMTPQDDTDTIAFGVTWAARRYMRTSDPAGYERLVARYGEPDLPMIRYARAFIEGDYAAMASWAPRALAALRDAGDDDVADLFEGVAVGLSLLLTGRLAEVDVLLPRLVERYRAQGPPSGLSIALTLLGTSASVQGRTAEAWQLFAESVDVAVPGRTQTWRNPLEARLALRRGDPAGAVAAFTVYVHELLDNDNIHLATIAGVEFLHLMEHLEHWTAVARTLGFLEAQGLLSDTVPIRAVVADAARSAAAALPETLDAELTRGRALDDRGVLTYMRDILDGLAD